MMIEKIIFGKNNHSKDFPPTIVEEGSGGVIDLVERDWRWPQDKKKIYKEIYRRQNTGRYTIQSNPGKPLLDRISIVENPREVFVEGEKTDRTVLISKRSGKC